MFKSPKFAMLSLLLFGAVGPTAQATEGLEWRWAEGQERRYLVRSQVELPVPLPLNAEQNKEMRITSFIASMDLRCTVQRELGKKAWELRCDIADLALSATPIPNDAGRLEPVLAEFQANLKAGWLQLQFTKQGKVRDVGLEDVPLSKNRRSNEIHEIMRMMMMRSVAALDVHLPNKGDDGGQGGWGQRSSMAFLLPSLELSYASLSMTHQITQTQGDRVSFITRGTGSLNSGEVQGRPLYVFSMDYSGSSVFDIATGELVQVQFMVDGRQTASSASGTQAPYTQATVLELLHPEQQLDFGQGEELSTEP